MAVIDKKITSLLLKRVKLWAASVLALVLTLFILGRYISLSLRRADTSHEISIDIRQNPANKVPFKVTWGKKDSWAVLTWRAGRIPCPHSSCPSPFLFRGRRLRYTPSIGKRGRISLITVLPKKKYSLGSWAARTISLFTEKRGLHIYGLIPDLPQPVKLSPVYADFIHAFSVFKLVQLFYLSAVRIGARLAPPTAAISGMWFRTRTISGAM